MTSSAVVIAKMNFCEMLVKQVLQDLALLIVIGELVRRNKVYVVTNGATTPQGRIA
jgi:hypothetical protein